MGRVIPYAPLRAIRWDLLILRAMYYFGAARGGTRFTGLRKLLRWRTSTANGLAINSHRIEQPLLFQVYPEVQRSRRLPSESASTGCRSDDRSLPWPILTAFALWQLVWIGRGMKAVRRDPDESSTVGMQCELLLAGSATAMIYNGVALILLSRSWSQAVGPDPIDTLSCLATLFLFLTLGGAATVFYRSIRRRLFCWLLSLLIWGGCARATRMSGCRPWRQCSTRASQHR